MGAGNTRIRDLSQKLDILKWKQADLSRRIKVSQNAISAWMTGKSDVPEVVLLYLELLCEFKRQVEK